MTKDIIFHPWTAAKRAIQNRVRCRGDRRAGIRRRQKAIKKALAATTQHGRAMAARDLELAQEWEVK